MSEHLLRRGVKLFNRGRFFDAHEALEDLWRDSPSGNLRRRHLQGLVQLAVAFHHWSAGNMIGARSVLDRALRNLSGAEESLVEIDVARLRSDAYAWRDALAAGLSGNGVEQGLAPPMIHLR